MLYSVDKLQWTQFVRLFAFCWSWWLRIYLRRLSCFYWYWYIIYFQFAFAAKLYCRVCPRTTNEWNKRMNEKKYIYLVFSKCLATGLVLVNEFFFLRSFFVAAVVNVFFSFRKHNTSPFSSLQFKCISWIVMENAHRKKEIQLIAPQTILIWRVSECEQQKREKKNSLQIRLLLFARYALPHIPKTIDMEDIWELLRSIFINFYRILFSIFLFLFFFVFARFTPPFVLSN